MNTHTIIKSLLFSSNGLFKRQAILLVSARQNLSKIFIHSFCGLYKFFNHI